MLRSIVLSLLGAAALAGCSLDTQPPGLLVSTVPPGAACIVTRAGQPIATAAPTPAIAPIEPLEGELGVKCRRHAFDDAAAVLRARKVGERVDYSVAGRPTSDYPDTVTLVMTPKLLGAPE